MSKPHINSNLKKAMTKIYSLLTAGVIAFLAVAPQASAQSIRDFKDELAQKLGNKKNIGAAKAISRVVKKYTRRLPDKAVALVRIGNKDMLKVVKKNLMGKAADFLLTGASQGFIGANGNLDRTFNRYVRLVMRKLPGSQKTDAVAQRIANSLIKVNRSRGGLPFNRFITDLVFTSAGLVPPVS